MWQSRVFYNEHDRQLSNNNCILRFYRLKDFLDIIKYDFNYIIYKFIYL